MTDIQKFMVLQGALEENAVQAGLLDELRYFYPYNRDLLSYFIKLAKQREFIFEEMNKLPRHMSA